MKRFGSISRGIAIATLLCFAAPQAQAIEVYGAGTAAAQLDEGMIVQVRGGRGGGSAPRRRRHASRRGRHASRRRDARGGGMHGGGMHAAEGRIAAAASPWRRLPWRGVSRRDGLSWGRVPRRRVPWRDGLPRRCLSRRRVSRRRLPLWRLDTSGLRLGAWRRDRSRRSAWLCKRRGRRLMGWRGAGSESLLVLYRPEPPEGLLGRLPVTSWP